MLKAMVKYFRDRVMLQKFKKEDKLRTKEIQLIKKLWDLLKEKGITKYDKLLNACIYVSLCNRDIYYLAEHFYFEKNRYRKNFFGRLLSMTIIEFLEDINHLLGKELKDELIANNMNDLVESVKEINKTYSDLKKKFNTDLRKIRNEAAAHKNKDAPFLLNLCDELPLENLTEIGYEMGKIENDFVNITTKILEEAYATRQFLSSE